MAESKPSHPQQETSRDPPPGAAETAEPASAWHTLRDAGARQRKQWRAHADLLAEQTAEQTAATLHAGLRLWGESLRAGWTLGRQWQTLTIDAWRRSLDLLR